MATKYWLGTAPAVKQVGTFTLGGTWSATTTYKITIGGIVVSALGNLSGATNNATFIHAFQLLLTASTEPYFKAIVWTDDATSVLTATALVAGVPFVATSSQSGSTGTIGAYTAVTASSGPNDWSTAANWSDGAAPVSTDTVILAKSGVHIAWGLDQNAVTLAAMRSDQSFTGNVGLDFTAFATSLDGQTVDKTRPEYRVNYLKISVTAHTHGLSDGIGRANGSKRFLINYGSNAATVDIIDTASNSAESTRNAPAVRILCNHSSTVINVRSAPGGVGIANEVPGETSTLATLAISDTTTATKVFTGRGVTLTTWSQAGGANGFNSDHNPTTISVAGGTLETEGTMAPTTINNNGGTVYHNHSGSNTNTNLNSGNTIFTDSPTARALGTVTVKPGAKFSLDPALVTFSSFVFSGRTTAVLSAA